MTDLAFLRTSFGHSCWGWGRFEAAASPPESGAAFYVNDFALSDPKPWKVPEAFSETRDGEVLPEGLVGQGGDPEIAWRDPDRDSFAEVFADIKSDIADGRIKKSVPIVTERGTLVRGEPRRLVPRLHALPAPHLCYGFIEGADGFLGGTPERLFSLEGDRLTTMAVAGTAPSAEREVFLSDTKEIQEHELVAQYLIQHLTDLGQITREPRECMELGLIVHFLTKIVVALDRPRTIEGLIHRLHPTPALGSFPRSLESLRKLQEYREQLAAPSRFGAPFGVAFDGEFHSVVAIRNISWSGERVCLPSGCGVIEESTLENEWDELALKRQSVREIFGL